MHVRTVPEPVDLQKETDIKENSVDETHVCGLVWTALRS